MTTSLIPFYSCSLGDLPLRISFGHDLADYPCCQRSARARHRQGRVVIWYPNDVRFTLLWYCRLGGDLLRGRFGKPRYQRRWASDVEWGGNPVSFVSLVLPIHPPRLQHCRSAASSSSGHKLLEFQRIFIKDNMTADAIC